MAEDFGRRIPSDRGIEQAIVALKKGAHLLKCGRRGKPKFCAFRLSTDERFLIWYSGDKEKHLKLNAVSKVLLGQHTDNFLRQCQSEKESQSLSLIFQNGERSLDLICKDKEQAKSWFLGLNALVSASRHPKTLLNLRDTRGTHSCVNSPVGHIGTNQKLGLPQDSVKLSKVSQVHSLHGSPPRSLLKRYFPEGLFDSSNVLYSPRQRTLSDVQPYMEKMSPLLHHVVIDNFRDIRDSKLMKEPKMALTSKIRLFDHGSPLIDKTDALKDVFMWGQGIGGILGVGLSSSNNDGSNADALLPKLLDSTSMLDVQKISCGERHAALVTKQGEVFCWGEENGGRLGHKINMDVPYPKIVDSLSNVCMQTIACGAQHTCALTSSGELYVWGDSSHSFEISQDGSSRSQWFPHRMSGPLDGICISKVACGEWHTALVSFTGQLFTYGDGTFGVLGHGNLQSYSEPKEVESLKGLRVKSVACGPWHTAAVVEIVIGHYKSNTPGGTVFTWGDSDKGRLGHADKERKLVPTCVASLVDCDFIQVSCGTMLTVALTVTGIVFTMGSTVHGQLGNPHSEDILITVVEGLLKNEFVKEISSGSFHVAALTTKGKVYTWGKGESGQLGLGDTKDRSSPALVDALDDRHAESVACGSNFTAAICLHKSILSKDQSICSGCRTIFGFSRKKHNCYNCGLAFCNSCSSNKAMNASLAPNKSRKCRVCDTCFAQLEKLVDPKINWEVTSPRWLLMTRKGSSDLKTNKEAALPTGAKLFSPRVSAIERIKLIEGKIVSMQGRKQQHQCLFQPFLGTTLRWGQVACPPQFGEHAKEKSLVCVPTSKEELPEVAHVYAQHNPVVSKSAPSYAISFNQDLSKTDKKLTEELQRLHSEALVLTRQCQSKSLKLQQYKRKLEETWSMARDEAAKCKAAKDVIKVLTNQINALSDKLSEGSQIEYVRSMQDDMSTCQSAQTKLSEPEGENLVSGPSHLSSDVRILKNREIDGIRGHSKPSSNAVTDVNESFEHQEDERLFDDTHGRAAKTRNSIPKTSTDEWVEQNELGVYITFITLPGGQKGLKRVRFSRKHFSEEEAERWWEENQTRVYEKYNIQRIVTSTNKEN